MVTPVPVKLKLDNPRVITQRWQKESKRWVDLNAEAGGHPDFSPLIIKAAYVFGTIHNICDSVDCLLNHPNAWSITYLSAFGVCASGIELLGRCLRGNSETSESHKDLEAGFEWLRSSAPKVGASQSAIIITSYRQYEVNLLTTLRHYTAHGQATVRPNQAIALDIQLLDAFPQLIGDAMERYWDCLRNSEDCCERLAEAKVYPLRPDPIKKIWKFFDQRGTSAGTPFYDFNWAVNYDWRV